MNNDKLTLDCSFRLQEIERLGYDLEQDPDGKYVIFYDGGGVWGYNKGNVINEAYTAITGNEY